MLSLERLHAVILSYIVCWSVDWRDLLGHVLLLQVMRVTYIGQNCPGGEGKGYKKRMRCADVKGQFE